MTKNAGKLMIMIVMAILSNTGVYNIGQEFLDLAISIPNTIVLFIEIPVLLGVGRFSREPFPACKVFVYF